jgi:hypothetical protein
MIRDSQCWDRRTLKRGALHRKKLGPKGSNFTAAQPRSTQYLEKFCAEMTHIWPRIRQARDGPADGLIVPGPQATPDMPFRALRRGRVLRWIAPRSIRTRRRTIAQRFEIRIGSTGSIARA